MECKTNVACIGIHHVFDLSAGKANLYAQLFISLLFLSLFIYLFILFIYSFIYLQIIYLFILFIYLFIYLFAKADWLQTTLYLMPASLK